MIYLFLFWIACGVIGYGLMNAYLHRSYPLAEMATVNRLFSLVMALFGPADLLAIYLLDMHGKGWML